MPNKQSSFWQELKRRNVTRVLAVYIAAAFMVLELVDMISEPFGLPGWSMKVTFFILLAGLIITVVVSWIYDIQPKEGIVKTEPVRMVKQEDIPKSSSRRKIASYISFVVIVGLIVLNIIPRLGKKDILDKSIAVIPFISLSDDPENQYLADGVMDAILIHLSKIEALRVMSRNTGEKYRETVKTATEIGQENNVAYLLEGSFQKYEDKARLNVQLISTSDDVQVWSNEYDRDWSDIFTVQSEVAKSIARELQIFISPEEKQRIEKTPTTNLTSFDFFNRGREEHWKHWTDRRNQEALDRAEDLYRKTLEYDSAFAQAYTGLAWVYYDRHYEDTYFSENFLDSIPILCEVALSFDNQLPEAYQLKGVYYMVTGKPELALIEYDQALALNPNDWMTYYFKGSLYMSVMEDYVQAIQNMQEAVIRNRGMELVTLLGTLGSIYSFAGFIDKAIYYTQEVLKLDGDSLRYYTGIAILESMRGNYSEAVEIYDEIYSKDSSQIWILGLVGNNCIYLDQYEKSLNYFKRYVEKYNALGWLILDDLQRVGYANLKTGHREEADYYFKKQIEYAEESIRLGRDYASSKSAHYDLAGIYAFLGDTAKAYQYLDEVNSKDHFPLWWITLFKDDPLFDSIRDETRFQKILQDIQGKYRAEHERVRQWLEENDLL